MQEYRTSHKTLISKVFEDLCSFSTKIHGQTIVTYRLKRFESIIKKLDRYPKMKFSRMWDIGGCRCIVRNNREVYRLADLIRSNFIVKKEYDYIKEPQKEGYRSLHLFVTTENSDKTIEVQIRNQRDHNWATLVEISDLIFDAGLKEYSKNKDLLHFHYLLSKDELNFEEKQKIATTLRKYKYFEKLNKIFARNNPIVREQWIKIKNQPVRKKYFLLEVTKDNPPIIKSYSTFGEAENEYFKAYKVNKNANIVLTHLPSSNFNDISVSYSNYILTFHSFLTDCLNILEDLIVESKVKAKHIALAQNFELYHSIFFNHVSNIFTEFVQVVSEEKNTDSQRRKRIKRVRREWIKDLNKKVSVRRKCIHTLHAKMDKCKCKYKINSYISEIIANRIGKKYLSKMEKLTITIGDDGISIPSS